MPTARCPPSARAHTGTAAPAADTRIHCSARTCGAPDGAAVKPFNRRNAVLLVRERQWALVARQRPARDLSLQTLAVSAEGGVGGVLRAGGGRGKAAERGGGAAAWWSGAAANKGVRGLAVMPETMEKKA
jgi:hypothetical protein